MTAAASAGSDGSGRTACPGGAPDWGAASPCDPTTDGADGKVPGSNSTRSCSRSPRVMLSRSPTRKSATLVLRERVGLVPLVCAAVTAGAAAVPDVTLLDRIAAFLYDAGSSGCCSRYRRLASGKETLSFTLISLMCFSLLYMAHERDQAAWDSLQLGHLWLEASQASDSWAGLPHRPHLFPREHLSDECPNVWHL